MPRLWEGYGDIGKHAHELPRGEKWPCKVCNHDSHRLGKTVKCAVKGCNMTLGRVCGGCGGVY